MAAGGGFSFGQSTNPGFGTTNTGFGGTGQTSVSTGGFSFGAGNSSATPSTGGFSFAGQSTTKPTASTTASYPFGSNTTTTTASTGGFSFGTTTTPASSSGGYSFGSSNPASRGGMMFGMPSTTTSTVTATPAAGNSAFSFGNTPSSSAPAISTFGTPSTQTSTGGLFGFKPQSSVAPTTSSGLSFGQQTTSAPIFGALGTATTTTASSFGGFSFSKTATTSGPTLGSNTGFGLGGSNFLSSTTTSAASITGSISSSQVASKGLGGVDPKVSAGISDGSGQNGKQINSKALKESQLPNQLSMCVEPLKKYIKQEKTIRENISRMTSKSMLKIQAEMTALRQILGTVSNGVQRNAVAVEKLKKETVQELKNTEMGQRTEEISAVLQDENTAPTEYFQHLFEDFEVQMKAYKVEIQNLESHIMSLHQPSRLTPEELTMLLRKSHENFLALAALFHQVHESVKTLKEKYLNYRRIFLGDTKDIFELKKKASCQTDIPALESQQGPNPFSGFPSTTAIALAAALSRNQQASTAPPAMGLGTNLGQPTGFGSAFGNQTSLFANTGTGSLFGNTSTNPGYTGFGTNPSQASSSGFSFGSNTAAVKPLG